LWVDGTVFHDHSDVQSRFVRTFQHAVLHFLTQLEQFGTGLCQVEINRIDLLDGRQQGCFILSDQRTFRYHLATDASGNRCCHCRILKIEFCLDQFRFRRIDIGCGLFLGSDSIVIFLFADGIDFNKRRVPFQFQISLDLVGFCTGQRGFCALDGSLVIAWIDLEQKLSLFDVGTFFKSSFQNNAGDTGTNLGSTIGFQTSRQFILDHHLFRGNSDKCSFRQLGRGSGLVAARCKKGSHNKNGTGIS